MTFIGLDTNVLAYLAGVERHPDDAQKVVEARRLIGLLSGTTRLVVPVQALAELFVVLVKAGDARSSARETVLTMSRGLAVVPSRPETLAAALDLATDHKLQLWDALILNAAADAGCTLLLSEDMHPGFTVRGLVVVNPFAAKADARLARLLV